MSASLTKVWISHSFSGRTCQFYARWEKQAIPTWSRPSRGWNPLLAICLTEYLTEIGCDLTGGRQMKWMLSASVVGRVFAHLKMPCLEPLAVRIG